jgi:hypothetical protein
MALLRRCLQELRGGRGDWQLLDSQGPHDDPGAQSRQGAATRPLPGGAPDRRRDPARGAPSLVGRQLLPVS